MTQRVYFAEVELSPTLTRRTSLAPWDISHGGATYVSDGLIVSLGPATRRLEFANLTMEVDFNLVDANGNADLRDAVLSGSYRWRTFKLYKALWNGATGQVSDVVIVKDGILDSTNDIQDDGTVAIIVSSPLVQTQRSPENVATSSLHKARVASGVFGAAQSSVDDRIFESADRNFDSAIFGKFELVPATYKKTGLFGLGPKVLKRPEKPKRAGKIPETQGDGSQPARVFGTAMVDAPIINVWNPLEAAMQTTFGGITSDISFEGTGAEGNFNNIGLGIGTQAGVRWLGTAYPDDLSGIADNSRWIGIQYVVAVGPVDRVDVYFANMNTGWAEDMSLQFTRPDNTGSVSRGYIGSVQDADTKTLSGIVEIQWGAENQVANNSAVATSDAITSNHRGLGHVIATIWCEAGRERSVFTNGFPQASFRVINNRSKNFAVSSGSITTERLLGTYTQGGSLGSTTSGTAVRAWGVNFTSEVITGNAEWTSFGDSIAVNTTSSNVAGVASHYAGGLPAAIREPYDGDVPGLLLVQHNASNYARYPIHQILGSGTRLTFIVSGTPIQREGIFTAANPFTLRLESWNRVATGIATTRTYGQSRSFPRVFVDYLTDPVAGPNYPASIIDADSFLQASTAPLLPHQADGAFQGRQSYSEYITDLEDSSGIRVYEEFGQIKAYATLPAGSAQVRAEFTEANCESIKWLTPRNRDKFNRMQLDIAQINDELLKIPTVSTKPIIAKSTDYLAEDNNQDSPGSVDAPFLMNWWEEVAGQEGSRNVVYKNPNLWLEPVGGGTRSPFAQPQEDYRVFVEYATLLMDKSRYSDQVEIVTSYDVAQNVNLGSIFTVNKALYGWTGTQEKIFEAFEITDHHDGRVTITGFEFSNELFGGQDSFPGVIVDTDIPGVTDYIGVTDPTLLPLGANGNPGLPGAGSILTYSRLTDIVGNTGLLTGGYSFFNDDGVAQTSWTEIRDSATSLNVGQTDSSATNHLGFFADISEGDVITYFIDETQWIAYLVTAANLLSNRLVLTIRTIGYVDDTDDIAPPIDVPTDVYLRFSRAPRGADGANGENGLPGQDGIDGIDGSDGSDGNGVEYIFRVTSTMSRPSTPSSSFRFDQPQAPWSDDAPDLTATNQFLWRCQRPVPGSPNVGDFIFPGTWDLPRLVGRHGDDGWSFSGFEQSRSFVDGDGSVSQVVQVVARRGTLETHTMNVVMSFNDSSNTVNISVNGDTSQYVVSRRAGQNAWNVTFHSTSSNKGPSNELGRGILRSLIISSEIAGGSSSGGISK